MGLIVVSFSIFVFRINTGPWKLSLLTLPFIKVLYDFFGAIPKTSILLQNIDPFKVQPGMQRFAIGLGASRWGPQFTFDFTVKDAQNNRLSASMGDYLFFWLKNKSSTLPSALLFFMLGVSLLLLARRLSNATKFEILRKKDRKNSQQLFTIKVDFRKVDIYVSPEFQGTPFTGGFFRPYICIPAETHSLLNEEEISATIAHELGHIRQFDVVSTVLVQFLGDIFWFIPGYRSLSRKLDRMKELVADEFAVKTGAKPEYLASALLKLKEAPTSGKFILYSAFTRESSLLKIRVQRLLGETREKSQRLGWNYVLVRVVFSVLIIAAALNSTLAGNKEVAIEKAPQGLFKDIVDFFGLESYKE